MYMKKVFEGKSHNLYSSKSSVHVYVVKKGRNTPTSSVTPEGHIIKGKEGGSKGMGAGNGKVAVVISNGMEGVIMR